APADRRRPPRRAARAARPLDGFDHRAGQRRAGRRRPRRSRAVWAEARGPHGVAGRVLSGPIGAAPQLAETVSALEDAVAAGAGDNALDALGPYNQAFEPARTPYDWLSRDPA